MAGDKKSVPHLGMGFPIGCCFSCFVLLFSSGKRVSLLVSFVSIVVSIVVCSDVSLSFFLSMVFIGFISNSLGIVSCCCCCCCFWCRVGAGVGGIVVACLVK